LRTSNTEKEFEKELQKSSRENSKNGDTVILTGRRLWNSVTWSNYESTSLKFIEKNMD